MKKINWDKVYEITENKLNLQIKESSDLEFVNKDGETEKSLTRTKTRGQGDRYLVPGDLTKKTSFEDSLSGFFLKRLWKGVTKTK